MGRKELITLFARLLAHQPYMSNESSLPINNTIHLKLRSLAGYKIVAPKLELEHEAGAYSEKYFHPKQFWSRGCSLTWETSHDNVEMTIILILTHGAHWCRNVSMFWEINVQCLYLAFMLVGFHVKLNVQNKCDESYKVFHFWTLVNLCHSVRLWDMMGRGLVRIIHTRSNVSV